MKLLCTLLALVAVGMIAMSVMLIVVSETRFLLSDGWLLLASGLALAFAVRRILGLNERGFLMLRISSILMATFLLTSFWEQIIVSEPSGLVLEFVVLVGATVMYIGIEIFMRAELRVAKSEMGESN